MPMVRKVYVLLKDVKNKDDRPRTGPFRDMPKEFEEGEVFIHEVVVPLGRKKPHDLLVHIDDDDMATFTFERGTPMYERLFKKGVMKRAKPGVGRMLHEYNAYMPHTVSEILMTAVKIGKMSLRDLEDVVIAYRRNWDYDMLDEDDTMALPKPGRSKMDEDEGGTDPMRQDYDPDMTKYVDPETGEEYGQASFDPELDEDDDLEIHKGEDLEMAEAAIEKGIADEQESEEEAAEITGPHRKWKAEAERIFQEKAGKKLADLEDDDIDDAIEEAYDSGDTAEEFVDWYMDVNMIKPAKPKPKPKAAKKAAPKAAPLTPTRRKPTAKTGSKAAKKHKELADAIYDILASTPGKSKRLGTLAEMTGATNARDVYVALGLLKAQGRIDDKHRAVIKGKKGK